MSTLDIYRGLCAAETGHAVPRRSVRHTHLGDSPLVMCALHLANEIGAVVGIVYGTERDAPQVVAVGNPLDRATRFPALVPVAEAIVEYVDLFRAVETRMRTPSRGRYAGRERAEVLALDTPQIVTPNAATRRWLGDVLSRSLRYLRADEQGVDPLLPLAGAHLTAITQEARSPLSAMAISATELLAAHWTTGQLKAETENLHSLLGWIAPPPGSTGRAEGLSAEATQPPAGPVPDVGFDGPLYAAVEDWRDAVAAGTDPVEASERMRAAVLSELRPAYNATFDALAVARELTPGAHDGERHAMDRRAWARHLERADGGQAFFRRLLDALSAARVLQRSEAGTQEYERQQALDDPEVMRELIVDGNALRGRVTAVDPDHRIGRRYRPRVTLEPRPPYLQASGARLTWAAQPATSAEVIEVDPAAGTVTVQLAGGMGRGRPRAQVLPSPESTALFSPYGVASYYPPTLPDRLPWTHAAVPAGTPDGQDPT